MSAELVQIVPMLPPAISGVGDYALLLAGELESAHGTRTRFLNADPGWRGAGSVASFAVEAVSERSERALLQALGEATGQVILLHYVGYGYARRGCPFWLVRALEKWKRRTSGRLILLFHEVSGSGPIWTSGFWTLPVQDWLAKRLACLADSRRVTTEYGADRLRAMLPRAAPIRTLAVFSTLGEPATQVPYEERSRQMVVFGSGTFRKEAYIRYLPEFAEACRRLRIERVVDIGVPLGFRPELPVPFVEAGILAAPDASRWMGQSLAGFFTYPVTHMGKSTVFAAYCAHGVTPVTFASNVENGDDDLRPQEHFLALTATLTPAEDVLRGVAESAHAWYRRHRLEVHAREIQQTVLNSPTE